MSTENVSSSSPSCPPVFGRKQGGQRRGKTYVFKLVVLKSTKTFLPKLTFAKEILILPVKPLRVQESTTACQNKKKKEKKSLFINFPPQSYCKVAVKTQPFLDEEPGSLQMQITQPERWGVFSPWIRSAQMLASRWDFCIRTAKAQSLWFQPEELCWIKHMGILGRTSVLLASCTSAWEVVEPAGSIQKQWAAEAAGPLSC